MQVVIPNNLSRFHHSATAFNVCPGLTEVTLFGGCPGLPSYARSYDDYPQIANTTVLRFGESCIHINTVGCFGLFCLGASLMEAHFIDALLCMVII